MDLVSQKFYAHESDAVYPIRSPPISIFGSSLHHSHTGFPIIAVAIIGILATAFLLVSYYVFVIKCCLNWHRIDLLSRFSSSRRRRVEDPLMVYSPAAESHGLDEAAIRSIPTFQYKKGTDKQELAEKGSTDCAVCLNEFQEDEKLRGIPNCGHVFHIDCIDVWLQNNANCPLCRTSISATRFPIDQILSSSTSPQDPNPHTNNFTGRDDYVVIEIAEHDTNINPSLLKVEERLNSSELSSWISPSPSKLFEQKASRRKAKRLSHISSMGDECIDNRQKDEQFVVRAMKRRSFSMDSAADRQLYLAVQEIVQQNKQVFDVCPNEGSSNKVRSFFSFGQGRGSRSAIQPVPLDP
ncbi:RING-H2 finger protein ATL16-like [Olea europaea var. sylvestris]|uniref:RING-H2 finger protein ATL16-like n=1 Tax=Olea europaea var. sylvestris TaxID=158386 RepID=UPI000C1D43AD|nr:RING-H2 finger protein ATL16-like [Olea europaea var. sylvestris]